MSDALVLIAEDEPQIAEILDAYLIRAGFRTVRVGNGELALAEHRRLAPDLVILDIGLPRQDGIAVLTEIRRRGATSVIMASALGEDLDKLGALALGADDYVVKPFNPLEVVARVQAVLRRSRQPQRSERLRAGPIEIDLETRIATVRGEAGPVPVSLTPTEFAVLASMMSQPRRAFERGALLDAGAAGESEAQIRTVDSHVGNLRRKLAAAGAPGLLEPVRGVGYRLLGT